MMEDARSDELVWNGAGWSPRDTWYHDVFALARTLPDGLPCRHHMILAGIRTADDLRAMSDEEIRRIHGIGPAYLARIRHILDQDERRESDSVGYR